MEKSRLTYNNMSLSNLSQSVRTRKNILNNPQKTSNIIRHYKLIKKIRKDVSNKHKQKLTSNSVYINGSKITNKYKLLFKSPGRRINSTRMNPNLLYRRLNFVTLAGNESYSDKDSLNKRKQDQKKLNAYYYSANIPIKNKYIVDSLSQDKPRTMRNEKKNKVAIIQKKIDNLAKNLNLFQYKKKSNNLKNVKSPFTKRIEKIAQKEFMQSYNGKLGDLSNNTKSSVPSKIMQYSSFEKTCYSKNTQRSNLKLLKDNTSLSCNKEILDKTEINKLEESKENNSSVKMLSTIQKEKEKEKKIMKNAQTSAKFMEAKDEFLYKKIFHYNTINRKKKTISVIDNKLNIFYSENLWEYNRKLNRINDMLAKQGKPMIHLGVERNSQTNMERMIKKIQFIKKIVDYVYPNMVLFKVKQENKRLSKIKSLDFKFSRSQINLLNLRYEQRKLDSYFGQSVIINKL